MAQDALDLRLPAAPASLKEIRSRLSPLLEKWAPADAAMLLLALDECCSNVIRHRSEEIGEGTIRLRAEFGASVLRFRIGSFCRSCDLPGIRPRDLDEVRPGGLGTHFVREIMSRISYEEESDPGGALSLVLEKDLDPERDEEGSGCSK
jgi:anti-sigma regulatory factor (Ser/Thr protein kinase)